MEEKKIIKETIDDGVLITEYSDGTTTFKPIKEESKESVSDRRTWLGKAVDWYKNAKIKPVIKINDLNKPDKKRWWDEFDDEYVENMNSERKEKPSVVVGIGVDF